MKKLMLLVMMLVIVSALPCYAVYDSNNSMLTGKADNQTIVAKPDKALVVFMRPRQNSAKSFFIGDPLYVGLYDVSTSETKFITGLMTEEKFVYEVDPGEYVFMVTTEAADFLKAKVVAGKIYYVSMHSRYGNWKARYSFYPQRQADLRSEEFREYNEECVVVSNLPAAEQWAAKKAKGVEKDRREYWADWLELDKEEQDEMTINPEDGI